MNTKLQCYLKTNMQKDLDIPNVKLWQFRLYALLVGKIIYQQDKSYSTLLNQYVDKLDKFISLNQNDIKQSWNPAYQPISKYLQQWTEVLNIVIHGISWSDTILDGTKIIQEALQETVELFNTSELTPKQIILGLQIVDESLSHTTLTRWREDINKSILHGLYDCTHDLLNNFTETLTYQQTKKKPCHTN
jgi:hypothetical protein